MADSIVIYFSSASWNEIAAVLEEIAWPAGVATGHVWAYPPVEDNHVQLYQYNDIFQEYEEDDVNRVKAAFAGLPATTLCIELRRSKADVAVDTAAELTILFLKRFPGLADDLIGDLWSLEEIVQGSEKGGMKFLDCYRQKTLWKGQRPAP